MLMPPRSTYLSDPARKHAGVREGTGVISTVCHSRAAHRWRLVAHGPREGSSRVNKKASHSPPLESTRTSPLLRDSSPPRSPVSPPSSSLHRRDPQGRLQPWRARRRRWSTLASASRVPTRLPPSVCSRWRRLPAPSLPRLYVSTHWCYVPALSGFFARGFGLGSHFGSAQCGFVKWRHGGVVQGRGCEMCDLSRDFMCVIVVASLWVQRSHNL
jgi:hypothetical protein